ncbi:MAG: glycogen debranching enzyme family protein [Cyclobacteriaceae bacterium]|nr:glycogen debranching enzyme family protein [Cyclobacteriaceae bacterium]
MKPTLNPSQLHDFQHTSSLEWLETNGIGGYASGTVSGTNTRRYHGLLVAATQPPVGRRVMLSKLEETIRMGDEVFELSANQYPGVVHPQGFQHLKSFNRELFPEFTYQAGSITLRKTIASIHNENTTVIWYEVLSAPKKFTLELLPLYSCKDFHHTTHANDSMSSLYLFSEGNFRTLNYLGSPELFITVPESTFTEQQGWYFNFEFAVEQYRGLDFTEDLYTHGKFSIELKKGSTLGIIISTEDPSERDARKLLLDEKKRREALVQSYSWNESIKRLVLAADQFIVTRGKYKSIIAGYPWFSDWGRDTMIALPGLCLATGKFEDAKKILRAFAANISEGMLPNRFPDEGETPEYNTIDATLWFFQSVYKYYKETKDKKFIAKLLPILKKIIQWHHKGTRYNIKVDPDDGLLYGGQDGVQLTWMDAKVGDWVVTPRSGKAVEINALWYNALCIMEFLTVETGSAEAAAVFRAEAVRVKESFNTQFWISDKQYLYDYIDGDYKNDDLRPNQIYAVSLPFPLLTKDRAKQVFDAVENHLFTPKGLRSLSPTHPDYRPVYGGDVRSRDGAYHQGTVWSFLLGPYIDALMLISEGKGKTMASKIITNFLEHLDEACVGSVSEIFDGEYPHAPHGCPAQAWGVAEILRVVTEYNLIKKQ